MGKDREALCGFIRGTGLGLCSLICEQAGVGIIRSALTSIHLSPA